MIDQSKRAETETLLARQLGHLIRSGLSYDKAFQRLREIAKDELGEEVASLKKNLEEGAAPSGKQRRLFTPVVTLKKLIAIARNEGGNAESILANAEEMLGSLGESYRIYWTGISSFLGYITALILLMLFVLMMFSVFVFPQLKELYDNAQGTLPALTIQTMSTLDTLHEVIFILVVAIVVAVAIIAYKIKTAMKMLGPISGLVSKLPGLSMLSRNYNSLLFINLSRLLASSGVALDTALKRVWELQYPGEDFDKMVSNSKSGLNLLITEDPVRGSLVLSQLCGTLDSEIVYLSSQAEAFFSEQLAKLREKFTMVAQISVGLLIAILVISMYLPIFHMGDIV